MQVSAITLDTDWAPDATIDWTREVLEAHNVKSTWFVTHDSPAIRRMRDRPDLFELGIHPNFLPGSSQGTTPEEVLDFCMRVVPEARSMRTHVLVQSTILLDAVLRCTPVRADLSLLLPYAKNVEAVEYQWKGETLLRVPYVWEDDLEMIRHEPHWSPDRILEGSGLRVFDFHPIHVFLNSADMKPYEALKAQVRPLSDATVETMDAFVNRGLGARSVFLSLVEHLSESGGGVRVADIQAEWRASDETR